MLVLPRVAHILRQVALADQHDADPGYLLQHLRQVADRPLLLAHDHDEHLALRVERPGVGALVIGLLVDAPIARGVARRVAALAGRLVISRFARPRIAAGLDRVPRLLDSRDMRPDDAVDADVEHLLGDELVELAAIGRDADDRPARRARLPDFTICERSSMYCMQSRKVRMS